MAELIGKTGVVSQQYLEALTSSHEVVVQADAYYAGKLTYANLPVESGTITASQRLAVRRSCSLVIGGEMRKGAWDSVSSTPIRSAHELSHHGQEIRVRHGIRFPNGSIEWVPVGRFRIEGHSGGDLLGHERVTITGLSFEAYVEEAKFPKPRTVQGYSAIKIIKQLIQEVLPQATFRVGVTKDRRVPKTTFDRERWEAITTLADSLGAVVYTDGRGVWCIDPATTRRSPSQWTLRGGDGGVLVSAHSASSREGVYNEVVVTNDNATTDVKPVWASARDDNPLSPTRYGDPDKGAFGKVTTFLEIPTLTSYGQAKKAAEAHLARAIGRVQEFTLTGVPIAPLEPGDVVDVEVRIDPSIRTRRHIVDEVMLPLNPGSEFRVVTRNIGSIGALGADI